MCFFVTEVSGYSRPAPVYKLFAMEAIGQEFHCMYIYNGVWIPVTLSSCVHCWPNKGVETFASSVLNEAVYFRTSTPSYRKNKNKGLIRLPFCNVKLDTNIFRGWDISPFSSAYVFIRSAQSFLLTKVLLNNGGKLAKIALKIWGTSVSEWTMPNKFPFFFHSRSCCSKSDRP